jgi:glycosyltransferase involved in cell wall biosynthesis
MKIGYLIPEFPGQTHIFFWREIQALQQRGIVVDLVSTRRPPSGVIAHAWSRDAMARTTYLSDMTIGGLSELLQGALRAGVAGWARAAKSIIRAADTGPAQRARLVALAFLGGRLSQVAHKRGWSHIHVHSCADSAVITLFSHLLTGTTYSMTLHGNLDRFGSNHREKWRNAAFGIVVNEVLNNEVRSTLANALPPRIAVVPMGVDVDRFRRRQAYVPWRSEGPLRIFSCGRLNPVKGHADLIQAIGRLRRSGIDVRLAIAGEDDHGGAGYRRELETLIGTSGLNGPVELLGASSEESVRDRLEQAHVFALASHWEALPVAPIEAMAMALPVVATQVGGVPELIADGHDGLLVSPGDPDALVAAIERVAGDSELAVRLGSAARCKVERDFHSGRSADVIAGLLREQTRASERPLRREPRPQTA